MEKNTTANVDFIDGQMINWDNMSIEQLQEMKAKLKKKEADLLKKIDAQLDAEDEIGKE